MEIYSNGEYMPVNEKFEISRQNGMNFSGKWRLIGAARFNNFGHQVEFIPADRLYEIRNWLYKNGKQKWHVADLDHGSTRIWMNPRHEVLIPFKA